MITRAIIWCCGVGRTFETEGHSAPPGHGREGEEGEREAMAHIVQNERHGSVRTYD